MCVNKDGGRCVNKDGGRCVNKDGVRCYEHIHTYVCEAMKGKTDTTWRSNDREQDGEG